MKKIIPILTLIGASGLIVGISNLKPTEVKNNLDTDISSFVSSVNDYSKINDNLIKTKFNRYNLNLITPEGATLVNTDDVANPTTEQINNLTQNEANLGEITPEQNKTEISTPEQNSSELELSTPNDNVNKENPTIENNSKIEENLDENDKNVINPSENSQISTLYSLSDDIENSCDNFCELKTKLTDAIIETKNLIDKVNSNQLNLTDEQRMFISEQTRQLKSLSKKLSSVTTELAINLSDLNQIFKSANKDVNSLNLKYLVVLDNLVNGNEMLENGLHSLNMINSLYNFNKNTNGKIIYRYKDNDKFDQKEYDIIDGKIIKNDETANSSEQNDQNNEDGQTEQNGNIDSYNQTNLNTNIDTYRNNMERNNIDTFFNTALLDNEFMFGNGANFNPYLLNQNRFNGFYNNAGYGVNNMNTPQDNVNSDNNLQSERPVEGKKNDTKNKKKLQKNIDTYKDENTPTLQARFKNITKTISNFFNKLSADKKDKLKNPIYKMDDEN